MYNVWTQIFASALFVKIVENFRKKDVIVLENSLHPPFKTFHYSPDKTFACQVPFTDAENSAIFIKLIFSTSFSFGWLFQTRKHIPHAVIDNSEENSFVLIFVYTV